MKKKYLSMLMAGAMLASTLGTATMAFAAEEETTEEAGKEDVIESKQEAKTIKILSIWAEDSDNGKLITKLTDKFIEEVNPNFNYEFEYIASADLTTRITTLVATDDLPDVFVYESGTPLKTLIENDKVVDITEALNDLGCYDSLEPAAASLLANLSETDDIYDLPLGLNVEGFWYNKELFEKAGIKEAPTTWDEFTEDCQILQDAGIQPLVTAGKDGWPATRLVNAYTFRSMGGDAMTKAANGEAKYTDEGYVAAAAAIQDLAEKGYFGEGVSTIESSTAGAMLMSGQAAMYYNGSWFAEALNSDENEAGPDGVGFFNVPVVDEKISPITEYSMNCGNVLCLSSKLYDDTTGEWLQYMVENLGNYAMEEYGAIKGYKYDVDADVTGYTQLILDEIGKSTSGVTWYEAKMPSAVSSAAQTNIQGLLNLEMTPEEYMQTIQDEYDLQ